MPLGPLRVRRGVNLNRRRGALRNHHLAKFRDAAGTAMEAGHTEEMLFRNYRELLTCGGELITPELAGEFWGILPQTKTPPDIPSSGERGDSGPG